MRVALIQPPMGADYPPLSLGSLAAYAAREGHTARVFDLNIPEQRSTWKHALADFDPGMVGITAMTPTIVSANKVATVTKEILPEATTVVGGYHVSFLADDAMTRYPAFDVGVIGEGELTLNELIGTLDGRGDLENVDGLVFRRDGEIVQTPPRARLTDIDSLPWPHDHYDLDWYLWYGGYTGRWTFKCASAIVSRGCPFRCRFCASQQFWDKKFLFASPEHVVDEMQYLARRGARSVYFRDSTFNANKKWLREFCEAKIRSGNKMRWLANSRVDTLNEELLVLMKRSGLEALYFGVESGSQRVLDYYNKGITVDQVRTAFELCHKHDIATAAFFMIGAPMETRDDIEQSAALARVLRARYTYWFIYTPLPGSPLYDDFLELGWEPDWENFVFNRATIPVGDLTCEDLEQRLGELIAEFERKATRGDVWRRRFEMLRAVRSLRDVGHLGRKLARRLGFAGAH